jgi:hypothetical protein
VSPSSFARHFFFLHSSCDPSISFFFPSLPIFLFYASSPSASIHCLLIILSSTEIERVTDDSYPLPPSCEDTEILRVVVRESLSGDLARKLLADIIQV